jgi:xyloglucan fucosyltransferase
MDNSCGRTTERGDDEPTVSWLGIEEVSPLTGKKDAPAASGVVRRWSSVVSATVVVLIMTMTPLLFLLSGRLAAPVVWIRSTVASVGAQRQKGNNKSPPLRRSISN